MSPAESLPRVAVVGATGAVGSTMLEVMSERGFAAREVVPLASARSAGRTVPYGDAELMVRLLEDGRDRRLRHRAVLGGRRRLARVGAALRGDAGCVVVDNSSAWRMEPNVPLVVAEVNGDALDAPRGHRREPELLDDADGDGAEADPRRGRASSA